MGCSSSDSNSHVRGDKPKKSNNLKANAYIPKLTSLLADYKLPSHNYFSQKVSKYFKDQKPPNSNQPFTDDLFPPNDNSIFGKTPQGEYIDKNQERIDAYLSEFKIGENSIVWKRAKDIFEGKYYIVLNGFSMNDINQGEIGNCYLMSSLSALANYPQLLAEIFRSLKAQENGSIEVVMRIDGEWQVIIIDDYFPCSKSTGKLIFAHPEGNELWVPIIEKAWAKANGGYLYINSGSPTEILEALTSFPIVEKNHIQLSDKESFWKNYLVQGTNNHWMMTCICPDSKEALSLGLPTGHVYTFIEAREADIQGENFQLVRLRNPWGSINWTGPFNDDDSVWTEEMLKAFKYDREKDSGDFWMSYYDYTRIFIETEICKTMSPSASKSLKFPNDVPFVFEFQIAKDSKVFFQIFRNYYRFNKDLLEGYNMPIHILLLQKNFESSEFKLIDASYNQNEDADLSLNIVAGSYLVYCYVNVNGSDVDERVRSGLSNILYVTANNYFELFPKGEDKNFELLRNAYVVRARELTNRNDEQMIVFSEVDSKSEICFSYIKNTTSNSTFSLNLQYKHKNTSLLANPLTKIILPPKAEYIAIASTLDCYESHSLNLHHEHSEEEYSEGKHDSWYSTLALGHCENFMKNCDSVETNQDGYTWIHSKYPIDFSTITS